MEARFSSSLASPRIEGFIWQEPEDDEDRQVYRSILEHGYQYFRSNPASSGVNPVDYCFSVGFYLNLNHPELLVIGLSSDTAGRMIGDIFRYVESGHVLEDGGFFRYDVEGREVRFAVRQVPLERYWDYFDYANWFYRSLLYQVEPRLEHKYPVVQLVWPDKQGFYPWEEACDPTVRRMQALHTGGGEDAAGLG